MISKKVILTGSFGVGKTSLFNQFIYQQFSDKYLTTIGVKVNKKTITVEGEEISLLLWDIAGEIAQNKVPESYFLGAGGIVYVVDLSRVATLTNMQTDVAFLKEILPSGRLMVVANKKDLITQEQLAQLAIQYKHPWDITTSAKTGENVEALFIELGKRLLTPL